MSPQLRARALGPLEQAYLYVTGSMKIVARPPEFEDPSIARGRPIGSKCQGEFGGVRKLAVAFVDGNFGDALLGQVADSKKVNRESLKAAVWRVRKEREGAA